MIRALFLVFCLVVTARASEPLSAPFTGASATIKQPHVVAELIPEVSTIDLTQPFGVILHLHMDPGWHTYWINPGDAGLATTIKWTLPEGFTAGPIQWPTPEKHSMGPIMTYGYEGDVYLITTITPRSTWNGLPPPHFEIKAKATWLVCQEECIPGKGEFTLTFDTGPLNLRLPVDNKEFFDQARARIPVPNTRWDVAGQYADAGGVNPPGLYILFKDKSGTTPADVGEPEFFIEQPNVLGAKDGGLMSRGASSFEMFEPLQQNGEKPPQVSGVLVSKVPLIGTAKAVYISTFDANDKNVPYPTHSVSVPIPSDSVQTGGNNPPVASAGASSGGPDNSLSGSPQATGGSQSSAPSDLSAPSITKPQPFLLAVLGAAFIGGLILNLMPCVLPVLSLKVFSLVKHAEHSHSQAWRQGIAFTVGVVISFWVLAGILIALRTAGEQLGWGFQMQSPGFVLALIFIFFLLGLNLFGVFELGTSLVGLDAKVTGRHNHGLFTSFLNGALATVAATPCTAPFMGSALGFAAQQPAYISLLIFTFLAFGMASPYLLLTIFPAALKMVPKPGAWMEGFKQFMGFLLMATVIFLVYVLGALVGEGQVPVLLSVLLLLSIGGWIYGRWGMAQTGFYLLVVVLAVYFLGLAPLAKGLVTPASPQSAVANDKDWQPWSQDAVQKALADGKPVFVDFTAAWCLSCKVNERVALDVDSVKKAFADKGVVLFKADWTHADPAISEALKKYNRDGVPLYLLYSPKQPDSPQVLPEVLTPGIVLDALNKM